MKELLVLLIAGVCAVSCGGSGTSQPVVASPVVVPPAGRESTELMQGLYLGSSTNFLDNTGRASHVVVLENQEIWSMEGFSTPVFFGHGLLGFNRFEPQGSSFTVGSPLSTLNANLLEGREFSVLKIDSAFGNDVLVKYDQYPPDFYVKNPGATPQLRQLGARLVSLATGFDYDRPADIKDVVGRWGKGQSFVVDGAGGLAGTALLGIDQCGVTGQLLPRPAGKNVFKLNIVLSGCPSGAEYSGIAYVFLDTENFGGKPPYTVPTIKLMAISKDRLKVFSVTAGRS